MTPNKIADVHVEDPSELAAIVLLAILVGFVTGCTIFFLTKLFSEKTSARRRRQSIFHKPGVIRPLLPHELMMELLEDVGFVLFFDSKCQISGGNVYKALRNLVERHPLLSARISTDTEFFGKEVRLFEEISENKSIDFQEINSESWETVFSSLMADKIDSTAGPLWKVRLVKVTPEKEPNKFSYALIFQFHQVICDGACLPDLSNTVLKDIDTLLAGDELETAAQCHLVHLDRLPPELKKPSGWISHIKLICAIAKDRIFGFKNCYLDNFPPPKQKNEPSTTKVVLLEFSREESDRLLTKCRNKRATFHGMITAAAGLAINRLCGTGPTNLHTAHAISIRKQCRPQVAPVDMGSFFTGMPMDLNIESNDDFWNVAAKVSKDIHDTIKARSHLRFASALSSLFTKMSYEKRCNIMSSGHPTKRKLCFSISNLGKIDDVFKSENIEIIKCVGVTAAHRTSTGSVFNHIVTTCRGKILWNLNYHTNVSSDEQAKTYGEKIKEILNAALLQ